MKITNHLILLTVCLIAMGCRDPVPELIITNGDIWTGVPDAPRAQAMAIHQGEIVAIGSDAMIEGLKNPHTEVINLGNNFVVPGFVDSHVHFVTGGLKLTGLQLRGASDPEEFVEIIAEYSRTVAGGGWITGGDWDHELWGGALPNRTWIDSVTADTPVFVARQDGHMGLANSTALDRAGIDYETPDPDGGIIDRNPETGRPTGILRERAMSLIFDAIPDFSAGEGEKAARGAMKHAVRNGVTQVHDMGDWSSLEVYRRLHESDELSIRIYSVLPLSSWRELATVADKEGYGDDRLWWGGVKGFVDGSLGSHTAWLHEPYADAPGTTGRMISEPDQLRRDIIAADGAELQVMVHAIGDRANDWLLDAYAAAERANGARDRRFRIEHAQHLASGTVARIADRNIIASMQPYHAIDDTRWLENRIGEERARSSYRFRSLLDAGADLAFGSDWTVAPMSPLGGIYAAVTCRTPDGKFPDGWLPKEKISVEDALRAYTINGAYAGRKEHIVGTLRTGNRADFVVLSADIFGISPHLLPEVDILLTVVDGAVVYRGGG